MQFIKFILHLDTHFQAIINQFGLFTYIIVFLIIFAETGFVVTPFLPGDSLLFVIGTFAGSNFLNIWISYFVLLLAAILGDTTNYWLGHKIGPKVFAKENSKIFNKTSLEKTHQFFEKYGKKAIILARFVPIIRSFAPFVAGVGEMSYSTFLSYNIIGAFLWVTLVTFAGYFFGGLPIIKNNFEKAVLGIIILSLLPILIEYLKHRHEKINNKKPQSANYQKIQKTFKKEKLKE